MNEEELKKGCGKKYVHSQGYDICGEHYGDGSVALCPNCSGKLEGFQKGKLEQKKEDIKIIDNFFNPMIAKLKEVKGTENITNNEIDLMIKWREQLQKEIGGKGE